ncbi:MAG: hypothetical protein U5K81_08540 [Trueperaceae bacterium]|nr:hypothetical protein [Trueperaceae bacterium]
MSDLRERLETLAALDAVSGHEQPMVRHLRDVLAPHCDDVEVDATGNLYATKRGRSDGPTVMIAAHTDEIGLLVKAIEPDGFLRFEKIGGVLDAVLPARLVRVQDQLGVIGMKAGHYQSEEERSRVRPHTQMYIDVGAESDKEIAERGIEVGDPVAFVSEVVQLGRDTPLVAGQAIDNRLGCAVLCELLLGDPPPAGTLVAAFTCQEEVGLKGAGVAGTRIQPDLGLALDTMPSGDTPDMDRTTELNVALGAGPCLQVMTGPRGKGFLLAEPVKRHLRRVAAEAEVPLHLVTATGAVNDATTVAWSGRGVPAAAICLPRRYSHSPLEVADMRDADATLTLLRQLVGGMDELPAFGFLDG